MTYQRVEKKLRTYPQPWGIDRPVGIESFIKTIMKVMMKFAPTRLSFVSPEFAPHHLAAPVRS